MLSYKPDEFINGINNLVVSYNNVAIARLSIDVNLATKVGTIRTIKRTSSLGPGSISKLYNFFLSSKRLVVLKSGFERSYEAESQWISIKPDYNILKYKIELKTELREELESPDQYHHTYALTTNVSKLTTAIPSAYKYEFIKMR